MVNWSKVIKNVAIVLSSAYILNVAHNISTIRDLIETGQLMSDNLEVVYRVDPKNPEFSELNQTEGISLGELAGPFWKMDEKEDEISDKFARSQKLMIEVLTAPKPPTRTLDIGLALEDQKKKPFLDAVANANQILFEYGVRLNVKETVNISIPTSSFDNSELAYGVQHSFTNPHEYYFAWSDKDFVSGETDWAAKTLTGRRVTLIDTYYPKKGLDRLIAQETLRLLSGIRVTDATTPEDSEYFKNLGFEVVDIHHEIDQTEYDTQINLEKDRVVTVNVALDGVSEKYAKKVLKKASDAYQKEFGISFDAVEYRVHTLPKGEFELYAQLRAMRDGSKKDSDIYLLLTNSDLANKEDENDSSFCGKANRQRGWALVETHRGERKTVETLIHEVGHLFNAKHIYLDDAFMHPYDSSANIWTAKTRETILTNKYRTWEWTD